MHGGEANPMLSLDTTVEEALLAMTTRGARSVAIVDADGVLRGLSPTVTSAAYAARDRPQRRDDSPAPEVMTKNPTAVAGRHARHRGGQPHG